MWRGSLIPAVRDTPKEKAGGAKKHTPAPERPEQFPAGDQGRQDPVAQAWQDGGRGTQLQRDGEELELRQSTCKHLCPHPELT